MTLPQRTAPQYPRYTGDEHVLVWDEHEADHNVLAAGPGLLLTGTGDPTGVVTADPGTLYLDDAGGANVTLWVKEAATDATGWVAK